MLKSIKKNWRSFYIFLENHLYQNNQKFRNRILKPVVRFCSKVGITPNMITSFRLFLTIIFFILYNSYRNTAIVLVTVSILLDGFDGVLARYTKRSSDKGKFLDITVDLFTIFMIVSTFLVYSVEPLLIIFYIILLGFTYVFAVIYFNEYKRTNWIIKPKSNSAFLLYPPLIAFYLFNIFKLDFLTLSLQISVFLSGVLFIFYYLGIQMNR